MSRAVLSLVPGFPIGASLSSGASWNAGYDISPDGRKVVFSSPDREGKLRLWLTPLDRRSPPRQIPNGEGEQPLFGPGSEIFFRKVEGTSAFLYSVREDGTQLRRAIESPVLSVFGLYPDRKWVVLGMATDGEVIVPIGEGARLLTHLRPPTWLAWTGDGKHLFVCHENEIRDRAYILPLSPGQLLPASITLARNFLSEAALAKLPGVRTVPAGDVVPGPTAEIYAFTRDTVQRNVYRIPIP